MAKESAINARLFVGGFDLSGDVGVMSAIRGSRALLDVTALDKFGMERLGGLADGEISFNCYFNPADDQAHEALSSLPTADRIVSYLHRPTQGAPAAIVHGKQINYDWARGADGALLGTVQALTALGYGLEWGIDLTAGKRTDTAATNGTGYDTGVVSTAFGWSAYLHLFAFAGTDVTVTIQDSADGAAWANLTGGAFPAQSSAQLGLTLRGGLTATVRRHLRVITTGTFNPATFAVQFVRFEAAQLAA